MSYPPPAYATPQKPQPRARWFVLGGVLIVLGIVIAVLLGIFAIGSATTTDAVVPTDGGAQAVRSPGGETRMLFSAAGEPTPRCRVADAQGAEIPLRGLSGSATVSTGGRSWEGFARVDAPADGRLSVLCTSDPTSTDRSVRVGAPLEVTGSFGLGLAGLLASIFLISGGGVVVLVVTTIVWFVRQPRPAYPGYPR